MQSRVLNLARAHFDVHHTYHCKQQVCISKIVIAIQHVTTHMQVLAVPIDVHRIPGSTVAVFYDSINVLLLRWLFDCVATTS